MAKKILAKVKMQLPAGRATPGPPVAPALGPHGVNLMEFCKEFNARTQALSGSLIPVVVTIYADRSFQFITKQPTVADMLRKTAGIEKGSPEPNRQKVGAVTMDQVREVAERKMPDLNASDLDAAMKIVMGTARSMGITVQA